MRNNKNLIFDNEKLLLLLKYHVRRVNIKIIDII